LFLFRTLFLCSFVVFIGQVASYLQPSGVNSVSHPLVLGRNRAKFHSFTNEDGIKEPETVDEHYELINALLEGWNAINFFPNINDCSKYS